LTGLGGVLRRRPLAEVSIKKATLNSCGYGVAMAAEVSLEFIRRTIGVYAGSSTLEPLAMNAL
jgi:hypothetical protein